MKKMRLVVLVAIIAIFTSCTSTMDLNVNSKNNIQTKVRKAYLVNNSYNSFVSEKNDNAIKKAFEDKGLTIVTSPDEADLFVFYSYGRTEPHTVTVICGMDCDDADHTESETVFYNYLSFVGIEAEQIRSKGVVKPSSKSYVSYYSNSEHFDYFFPYLLEALVPYLGKNLDQPITITKEIDKEKDKEYKEEQKAKKEEAKEKTK